MPPFKWTSENAQSKCSTAQRGRAERAGLNIYTHSHVIYLSESCHTIWQTLSLYEMAALLGFSFFVRRAHRRVQAWDRPSLICYHLHVEHTLGSLKLTWIAGSAMCHSCNVQSAKVTLRTNTHGRTRSHTDTHTHARGGSVIRCPVPCLHFGAADETCCVGGTLRTIRSVSGCSAFITFRSTGKELNCCRHALCWSTPLFLSRLRLSWQIAVNNLREVIHLYIYLAIHLIILQVCLGKLIHFGPFYTSWFTFSPDATNSVLVVRQTECRGQDGGWEFSASVVLRKF